MKTIVVCATIFCLELVSSYPFPEPLPGYYEPYVPQQIQIPNIARSPDLYHQQQLAYIQQQNENTRRQTYENLLRNENLSQRLLQRPSYNIQPALNTVREPYVNSLPLRPIQQSHYEAPITHQYYPVQSTQYQPVQSEQYEETRSVANAGTGAQAQQINNHPQQQYPEHNAQNQRYNPRIQQVLASTPLKKRYLVLHPNGTIEHIDKIEHIVEQHPNYILVNAGSVAPKPNVPIVATPQKPVSQQPVAPVAPAAPVVPATAPANTVPVPPTPAPVAEVAPVAPVAPSVPVVPATDTATAQANTVPVSPTLAPVAQVAPVAPVASSAPVVSNAALSSPLTPALIAPLAPVVRATAPGQANPDVPQSNANQPPPLTFAPASPPPFAPVPAPTIQNGTVPGPKPTVPPPTGPTTALPPVSAPMAQPPVILNGTVPDPTTVPPTGTPPAQPPIWVTATATAVYPPPTTPLPPTIPPPTVTPVTPVPPTVGPVTPVSTATPIPSVTDCPTTVAPYTEPSDPNTDLDILHLNNGVEPVVWFRTKDLDFWNKLTDGKETYDVVYIFNIPREPRVTKEIKITNHADGTVIEEITETIIDDEDETPPRVIKTTKVTKPDGTQSKT